MAKYALRGFETKPVGPRHGKHGFVQLNIHVPPLMKSKLIDSAEKHNLTLADEVRIALAKHLNGGA